jgi:hypothetical protein
MRNQLVTKLFQAKKGAFSLDELITAGGKGKKAKRGSKSDIKRAQKRDLKKRSSFLL